MASVSEFWKSGAWSDMKTDTIIDRGFTLTILGSILGNYLMAGIQILKFNKRTLAEGGKVDGIRTMNELDNKTDVKVVEIPNLENDHFTNPEQEEDYLNIFFLNKHFTSVHTTS